MEHRPVCVKCGKELRPKENGVKLVEIDKQGNEYEVWYGDLWQCPLCDNQIINGFGDGPIIPHKDMEKRYPIWLRALHMGEEKIYISRRSI